MEKTKTTVRVRPEPNPDPSSQVVSTGKHIEDVPVTRQRKRELPSSPISTVNYLPSISAPNPSPNPSHVVSTKNHTENVIVTRQRKRKLSSSLSSTINPKTQTTLNQPSSSASMVNSPFPISASNPSPKTRMTVNRPSSSVLKKNTCATSCSPNTRPNQTRKRRASPSSSTLIIGNKPEPKPNHDVIIIGDETPSPIIEQEQKTPTFTCLLCFWSKNVEDKFNIKGCGHFYCADCIEKYVSSKLENNVVVIGCPELGCGSKLELELCREVLSRDMFDRWGDALCESLIQVSQKFYCPFKDCSALLINDGGVVVRESECPNCRRLFCAQCKVPWHAEKVCEEFQRQNKEDQDDMTMKALAEEEKWTRCPSCKFYVQKIIGCNFIRCRCGATFCYLCGETPMLNHYCAICRR